VLPLLFEVVEDLQQARTEVFIERVVHGFFGEGVAFLQVRFDDLAVLQKLFGQGVAQQ